MFRNEELTRAEGFDDGKVIAIVFAILCIIAAVVLIILWKKRSSEFSSVFKILFQTVFFHVPYSTFV